VLPALPSAVLPGVAGVAALGLAGSLLLPALGALGELSVLGGAVVLPEVLPVVPLVVPLVLPVAPGVVLGGAAVLPAPSSPFFPHAPNARVATSAASNTECLIRIPLKKNAHLLQPII
jgi:hypothetical protein